MQARNRGIPVSPFLDKSFSTVHWLNHVKSWFFFANIRVKSSIFTSYLFFHGSIPIKLVFPGAFPPFSLHDLRTSTAPRRRRWPFVVRGWLLGMNETRKARRSNMPPLFLSLVILLSKAPWFYGHIYIYGWWFGTWILFSIIYGMSSFPLTHSYFSRWLLHHQPVIKHVWKMSYFQPCLGYVGIMIPIDQYPKGGPQKGSWTKQRNGVRFAEWGDPAFMRTSTQMVFILIFPAEWDLHIRIPANKSREVIIRCPLIANFQNWSSICWPGQYQLGKYTWIVAGVSVEGYIPLMTHLRLITPVSWRIHLSFEDSRSFPLAQTV